MTLRLTAFSALAILLLAGPGVRRAEATDYVVTNQASWLAFLAATGGTGSYASSLQTCYWDTGSLPAGSTLTMGGATMLRPQGGPITNDGTITINSTGWGFYGAGTFNNNGTFNFVAGTTPQNYSTIVNDGLFQTAVPMFNDGTFTNLCNGTVVGTITGNQPINGCAGPSYVVTDQASWLAFLAATGGTGSYTSSLQTCYWTTGGLPAGSTLTMGGATMLRPQGGPITNDGTIIINSTGWGFYGAGTFNNNGTVDIVACTTPQNYSTIVNDGLFRTAIPMYNDATFSNLCHGTVVGTITGNQPLNDCAVPVQTTTWSAVKSRFSN